MPPSSHPDPAHDEPVHDDADTTAIPTAHGSSSGVSSGVSGGDDRRAAAAAVLDRPLDDGDLASRVHRPGMARSTRILLALVLAVALVALGTWIGRATSKQTGPGSLPDAVGTVESVSTAGGSGQVTVRGADGTLKVFATSSGTKVATASSDGADGLRPGQQVTVTAQRNRSGSTDATLIELPAR